MQYTQAVTGRIFIVKMEHGDDLLEEIKKLILKEGVDFAAVTFLGALEKADIVAGPEKLELPATGSRIAFSDGREVLGAGTIVNEAGEVKLHLHASFGKGENALVGCLRDQCRTFITVEALITELKTKGISRKKDGTGHEVLEF